MLNEYSEYSFISCEYSWIFIKYFMNIHDIHEYIHIHDIRVEVIPPRTFGRPRRPEIEEWND